MTYAERKAQVNGYLGKTVTVDVDRPIGYLHETGKHAIEYPINYGHIPGVIGADGEELDVYILGVDRPLDTFTGTVIGIIHRKDDVEDKLVAAPEGVDIDQSEIAASVRFVEKYFKTRIEALYQKSCGSVIFRRTESGKVEYLLLFQSRSRTWSFPKGHMEISESEETTALREVREETGLVVKIIPGFREEVHYKIKNLIKRTIILFLSESDGVPTLRGKEIKGYRWVSDGEARHLLNPEYKYLLDKLNKVLQTMA